MRTVIIMVVLVLAGFALLAIGNAAEQASLRQQADIARTASQDFSKTLKQQLISAINAGGPEGAIGVCQHIAPETSALYATDDMQIGRTALKLRNPANTPDEWERSVLTGFKAAMAKGVSPKELERFEFIAKKGEGRTFRYMKAIPVGKPCLACHGSTISPSVREILAQQYPEDRAVDFEPGDLRGAFTITREMP